MCFEAGSLDIDHVRRGSRSVSGGFDHCRVTPDRLAQLARKSLHADMISRARIQDPDGNARARFGWGGGDCVRFRHRLCLSGFRLVAQGGGRLRGRLSLGIRGGLSKASRLVRLRCCGRGFIMHLASAHKSVILVIKIRTNLALAFCLTTFFVLVLVLVPLRV